MTIVPNPTYHLGCQDDRWLYHSPHTLTHWVKSFVMQVDKKRDISPLPPLDPAVKDLKELIESRPILRMWASAMFDEVPNKTPYNKDTPDHQHVRGYHHMLELFSIIATEVAPTWSMIQGSAGLGGLVGLPFQALWRGQARKDCGGLFHWCRLSLGLRM
jgi:phosphatidylserine decarboxylase